jgi:CRISPR-associated exonuclease Cas4
MYPESDLLPISGLQHIMFCSRQCALIHIERIWEENRLTAEGRLLHEKTHQEEEENRGSIKICRGLKLRSLELGLSGVADVVEFHYVPGKPHEKINLKTILPVEYKRGKEKSDDCDRIQLCAQAMCLEEMLNFKIASGDLYYGSSRRRTEVAFTSELRNTVSKTAERFHELFNKMELPPAKLIKGCKNCSLSNQCMPEIPSKSGRALNYLESIYKAGDDETSA